MLDPHTRARMGHRVLVVADSATMRSVFRVYLMARGFEFVMAEDGKRALEALRTTAIDLVIADVNMPKLDGLSFVRQVRGGAVPGKEKVPVILASSDHSRGPQARRAGADAFLGKPLDGGDELIAIVEQILPRSR